jgi:hypothetical protein
MAAPDASVAFAACIPFTLPQGILKQGHADAVLHLSRCAMAYHKHPDVQHAMRWVEVMLQEPGCCKADVESLRNGVIFCRLADSLLEHCVDLSQVRKQGNLETVCLHNLALLNKSLQRYKIKIPSKLQVSQTDHALARTGTHWLVHDQHILQAAFESIGQKRSSTQHIVNLLMCGACRARRRDQA